MKDRIIGIIERELSASGLTADSRFEDICDDSLEFVQIMVAIQDEVAKIPDAEFGKCDTVGDVIAAAERHIQ